MKYIPNKIPNWIYKLCGATDKKSSASSQVNAFYDAFYVARRQQPEYYDADMLLALGLLLGVHGHSLGDYGSPEVAELSSKVIKLAKAMDNQRSYE